MNRPNPPRHTAEALLARIRQTLLPELADTAQVGLELGPGQPPLRITRWHYRQRLHEPWRLELEASAVIPIADPAALLWQAASFWQRDGAFDFHTLHGRVLSLTEADDSADLTHYRLTLVPALQALDFTRRCRVFQRVNCLDIAQTLLAEHGLPQAEVRELREIPPSLPRWRQLSQHRDAAAPEQFESDLHFLRRVLAADGLSLWLEPDPAGDERLVIGRAGLAATQARSLPLSTPAGVLAGSPAEQLLDYELRRQRVPNIARLWAYNYRDQGRALRAEFEPDPQAPLGLDGKPSLWEEPAYGADALVFDGNHQAGVQTWLDGQARLLGQRQHQRGLTLQGRSNAAGLWRCGQTVQLGLPATQDQVSLLTAIEAGSDIGPELGGHDEPARSPHVHFEASPMNRWVQRGWAPELLHTAALDLEQAQISAPPGSQYAYLDPHGRYQIKLHADEQASPEGATSRPARHIRSHAGADYGWHLPLHAGTSVLVAFHGGSPDTPMIARALHTSRQPDHVTGRNASRNVLRTWANNKLRLEDKQAQEHIKLSTEYGLTQLNLGHHVTDQGRPRGEGFELRTQHWGALRAAQGLLISTFAGQPRGALAGQQSPAHQLYNPGAADSQGAQAFAQQRSEANKQVGLGKLEALAASMALSEITTKFSAPLIHAASAEHLLLLTPASQIAAVTTLSAAAQGRLELASADQIRLYAKLGISWHTEGSDKTGAGQGGSRADVISRGSDQTQVLNGKAQILAEQDIVLEFAGARGLLATQGATLELTQAGVLTITANREIVSEAKSHRIGGNLDWGKGAGSTGGGPLNWWGKMEVKDVCVECLLRAATQQAAMVPMP